MITYWHVILYYNLQSFSRIKITKLIGHLLVTRRGIPAVIRGEKSVTLISKVATIVPVENARTIDTPTKYSRPSQ